MVLFRSRTWALSLVISLSLAASWRRTASMMLFDPWPVSSGAGVNGLWARMRARRSGVSVDGFPGDAGALGHRGDVDRYSLAAEVSQRIPAWPNTARCQATSAR